MKLAIYTDGASRGNPGKASCGFVFYDEQTGGVLLKQGTYLGEKTNNQAEYAALILALKKATEFKPETISCYLDSQLVVKQLLGEYKVKDPEMKRLWNIVKEYERHMHIQFTHVLRHLNKEADAMANEALDRGTMPGETFLYSSLPKN